MLQNQPRCLRAIAFIFVNVVPKRAPVLANSSFYLVSGTAFQRCTKHTREFISNVDSRTSVPILVEI